MYFWVNIYIYMSYTPWRVFAHVRMCICHHVFFGGGPLYTAMRCRFFHSMRPWTLGHWAQDVKERQVVGIEWSLCITYIWYLDMDIIYESVFLFEIFVLCIVYYLYIIHAGFVVTSGGNKRCWFPCLKSEMTNQFDNIFELAWLSNFAGHSCRRLVFRKHVHLGFFFKWKNQVLTNINWLFRLVACTASNSLRLVIANVLIAWMRSLNFAYINQHLLSFQTNYSP